MDRSSPLGRDTGDLRDRTVAVYGLGKMGLPLAGVLADNGATAIGVDIDAEVVEAVNRGQSPVSEPGLQSLLDDHVGAGLTATTDGVEAARDADVMIVLVPAIVDENGDPDLSPVIAAGEAIGDGVERGDLVILESTVPPGTTGGEFATAIETNHRQAAVDVHVAHCPERTSSGRVIRDLTESYPKIVGALSAEGTERAAAFYETFNEPGVVELPSATAAEAVKVFEGVYRDVNIALANELATACEEWGLDASTVFEAANTQPYCDLHDPGVGVGGHCIPVYPHFVIDQAGSTPLLQTARDVNDGMPEHTVARAESMLADHGRTLVGADVLLLGVTYRPGVRETRFAPALDVAHELRERGASVTVHDPLLTTDELDALGLPSVDDPGDDEWDAVVLVTGHEAYRELDLDGLRNSMRSPVLVDGRDFFSSDDVTDFAYACVGDGTTDS